MCKRQNTPNVTPISKKKRPHFGQSAEMRAGNVVDWNLSCCWQWSAQRADSAANAAQGKPPSGEGSEASLNTIAQAITMNLRQKSALRNRFFGWGRDKISVYCNISLTYAFLSLSQLR